MPPESRAHGAYGAGITPGTHTNQSMNIENDLISCLPLEVIELALYTGLNKLLSQQPALMRQLLQTTPAGQSLSKILATQPPLLSSDNAAANSMSFIPVYQPNFQPNQIEMLSAADLDIFQPQTSSYSASHIPTYPTAPGYSIYHLPMQSPEAFAAARSAGSSKPQQTEARITVPVSFSRPFAPTFQRTYHIITQNDANTIVLKALEENKRLISESPASFDRSVIVSGHVYIAQLGERKRWMDAGSWTNSRKGNSPGSMIYRQLKPGVKREKSINLSETIDRHNCAQYLGLTECDIIQSTRMPLREFTVKYIGVQSACNAIDPNGMVKRTFTVTLDANNAPVRRTAKPKAESQPCGHRTFLVISYYNLRDLASQEVCASY